MIKAEFCVCANCNEYIVTVSGGAIFAAVTDVAFVDQSRTVWYEITNICSGLSFYVELYCFCCWIYFSSSLIYLLKHCAILCLI